MGAKSPLFASGPVFALDAGWRLLAVPFEVGEARRRVAAGDAVQVGKNLVVLARELEDGWTDRPARVLARGAVATDALLRAAVPWAPKGRAFDRLLAELARINRLGTVAVFDRTGRLAKTPVLAPRAARMVRAGHAEALGGAAIQLHKALEPEACAQDPAGHLPWRLVDPARLCGRLRGPHAADVLGRIEAWNRRFA